MDSCDHGFSGFLDDGFIPNGVLAASLGVLWVLKTLLLKVIFEADLYVSLHHLHNHLVVRILRLVLYG